MIFVERDKRNGAQHIVVSKYWPDGTRFRRRCPNKTVAHNLLDRIKGAIATGTWKELKKELNAKPGAEKDYTIKTFSAVYLAEYCEKRNTRSDFKAETLEVINRIVGGVKLKEFTRKALTSRRGQGDARP